MRGGFLLFAGALAACSASSTEDERDPMLSEAAVTSLDPNGAQPVAITDPAALRDLESRGFGFGHHFGVPDGARADALEATPGWSSISHAIAVNLATLKAADRELDVGMQHDHRLFDEAWLRSSRSRFVLVAVTNRLDRAIAPGDCGEVRFIHRLAYDDPREGTTSRMPMTVAVVVPQRPRDGETGCSGVATRWQALSGKSGALLAAAATSGPLASLPDATTFETNLQALRWPSSIRPDMGGEAEYMLNVWEPTSAGASGGYTAKALENTPDADAIRKDPAKKQALSTRTPTASRTSTRATRRAGAGSPTRRAAAPRAASRAARAPRRAARWASSPATGSVDRRRRATSTSAWPATPSPSRSA